MFMFNCKTVTCCHQFVRNTLELTPPLDTHHTQVTKNLANAAVFNRANAVLRSITPGGPACPIALSKIVFHSDIGVVCTEMAGFPQASQSIFIK